MTGRRRAALNLAMALSTTLERLWAELRETTAPPVVSSALSSMSPDDLAANAEELACVARTYADRQRGLDDAPAARARERPPAAAPAAASVAIGEPGNLTPSPAAASSPLSSSSEKRSESRARRRAARVPVPRWAAVCRPGPRSIFSAALQRPDRGEAPRRRANG